MDLSLFNLQHIKEKYPTCNGVQKCTSNSRYKWDLFFIYRNPFDFVKFPCHIGLLWTMYPIQLSPKSRYQYIIIINHIIFKKLWYWYIFKRFVGASRARIMHNKDLTLISLLKTLLFTINGCWLSSEACCQNRLIKIIWFSIHSSCHNLNHIFYSVSHS